MKLNDIISEVWMLFIWEPMDDNTLELMAEHFQERCPGNYTIQWDHTVVEPHWQIKFIFTDPEEEMLWRLKWQ